MNLEKITSLDDPRIDAYRNLKDRELARDGGRFIAEGEFVVRRLLSSDFLTESVLLAERRVEEIAPLAPVSAKVFVAPPEIIHEIIGFKFHSGVIACGRRKTPLNLDDILNRSGRLKLMVCPEIANAENLGGLIRIAAGFGIDAIVLGEKSCDPFFRQAIRVSMGTVFSLPIVQSENILADLSRMRSAKVETIATVLDTDAEKLQHARVSDRFAVVFGNEAQGLDAEIIIACSRKVTIPMQWGTDSLNVVVSAGVVLWEFTKQN